MNWRRASLALVLAAVSLAAVPSILRAKTPPGRSGPQGKTRIETIDNNRRIDVNQLNMWVTNYGSFAWDLSTGNSGLVWPKGTNKTAVFASGLWLGAVVGAEVRTVVAEYSQEYGPGSMVAGSFDDPSLPEYKTYKVVRFTGDPLDTAHVERTAEELSADPLADPLLHHSWSEYLLGAAPHGADTTTYRFPNTATSDPTDSVDVRGPKMLGDQMLWAVYNDADPTNHTNDAGSSTPLGVEIQQKTFGFNRTGPLGNTVFLDFKIINKGSNQLDSMFVSLWADPDLGGFTDDLVGVDTTLSLGYVYNSTNADGIYGTAPPSVGYDFFLGPVNKVTGDTLGLASFNKYINGTDPASTSETYNYMNGILPDGSVLVDPTTGQPTHFFHPGDPVLHTGWLDSNPGDRRFLLTAGPFSMAPGDTQRVVGAIIIGNGTNRLSSVTLLKCYDQSAQRAFDLNFDLPSPPPQPKVQVTQSHGEIDLCWDALAANNPNFPEPSYTFQGYNVYQGASVAGPWKRIATYDVVDAITVVEQLECSAEFGFPVTIPVVFGSNSGLSFCQTIVNDEIRGGSLKDATQYYFAVTAYSVDTTAVFPRPTVLENAQQVITVTPQRPAAGTDLGTASATPVQQFQINPAPQPTTDNPVVDVVSPALVQNATYRIAFSPLVPPFEGQVGEDTATVVTVWHLIRTSLNGLATNDTLLKNQINRRGDLDYQTVDGIRVRFAWPAGFEHGSYFPLLLMADVVPRSGRSINNAFNWSGNPAYFLGAAGYGRDFHDDETIAADWGSTLDPDASPDLFTRVELRFGATPSQKAYRFLRYELGDSSGVGDVGDAPPGGRRYDYGGFRDIPLQVWDVLENRQLDAAFVERILVDSTGTIMPDTLQPATFDSTYRPLGGGLGGREYFFVLGRTYDGSADATIAQNGSIMSGGLPIMYALWANRRGTRQLEASAPFLYAWVVPATANDYFTFSTSPLVRGNKALATSLLDRIRVVPNPYFNRSRYEQSQFNRIVRFINLPEQATVRIYNLAGDLVRTLQKTDPTSSVINWDLQTENNLPVASGVYIYHVDSPGVGRTFGRMIVFMEKERLNNF